VDKEVEPSIPLPEWVAKAHTLADEKGVTVVFIDDPVIPLCDHPSVRYRISPFYRATKVSGMASLFHGCGIKSQSLQDLPAKLKGFTNTGVSIDKSDECGFLSSCKAVYDSNSLNCALLWPAI
jgi:hypothetical protein